MQNGTCRRGDACPFAHGVFESWLHPSRYRTQVRTRPSVHLLPVPLAAYGNVAQEAEFWFPCMQRAEFEDCTRRTTIPESLQMRQYSSAKQQEQIGLLQNDAETLCFTCASNTDTFWPCSAVQMGLPADAEYASSPTRSQSSENQRKTLLCLRRSYRQRPLPVRAFPSACHAPFC